MSRPPLTTRIISGLFALLLAVLFLSDTKAQEPVKDPFRWNKQPAKGINIPATFNFKKRFRVPSGEHFQKIRESGFTAVRVPVNWKCKVTPEPPHTIDPEFFDLVDESLQRGLDEGLVMVLDFQAGLEFGDFSEPGKR